MDFSKISPSRPLAPPPPGVASNFLDPPSLIYQAIIAMAVTLPVAFIFLVARLNTRAFIPRSVKSDDYVALLSFAMSVPYCISVVEQGRNGLGTHAWDITFLDFARRYSGPFQRWFVAGYMLQIAALATVKIFMLLLYLRILPRSKKRVPGSIWTMHAFIAGYSIAGIISVAFSTRPVQALYTGPAVAGARVVVDPFKHAVTMASLNIVAGVLVILAPTSLVWKLQVSRLRKAGIMAMFATGIAVTAVSVIRLSTLVGQAAHGRSRDFTYGTFNDVFYSILELNIVIMAASMPVMRQLFRNGMPHLRDMGNKSHSLGQRGSTSNLIESTAAVKATGRRYSML
ncbi:MAG: hypothetical protein M1817_002203 [Caeruleum heppii]|nr:MAG: hypothetical protein M1817_002203 [Caeruleum heppii]